MVLILVPKSRKFGDSLPSAVSALLVYMAVRLDTVSDDYTLVSNALSIKGKKFGGQK